jgi:biotin-(acetyl-CoA carboxylase) ligase
VEDVLAALLGALAARIHEPPDETVRAWSERDLLRDTLIHWEGGKGIARGIAPSGALRVEMATASYELHAGEVALVRPAGDGRR